MSEISEIKAHHFLSTLKANYSRLLNYTNYAKKVSLNMNQHVKG